MVIQIQDRVAIADNAITAPKKKEPVSPINTFALCQLNNKKIIYAPITIISNIATAKFPYFIAYPIKNVKITIPTLDESPSTPSVKFTAFVVAISTTISISIFKIPAIETLSKKYIYIELFILSTNTNTVIVIIPTSVSKIIFFLGDNPSVFYLYTFNESSKNPISPKITEHIISVKNIPFCSIGIPSGKM